MVADSITLVSNSEKKHIEERLGNNLPSKFVVIHNGVNDIKVNQIERSVDERNTVIFAATSRLVSAKGIGELIEAFGKLSGDIGLWLLGEGPEEAKYRKQAKGNNRIHFLGFPENALSFVATADIFVHPSYHEGFSISLVEAASLGKPIIACDTGGNPEIVKNDYNGLLVPPRDFEKLAMAMNKLATHKELRKEYGSNARNTYEQEFVFSKIVTERFLPLYE